MLCAESEHLPNPHAQEPRPCQAPQGQSWGTGKLLGLQGAHALHFSHPWVTFSAGAVVTRWPRLPRCPRGLGEGGGK